MKIMPDCIFCKIIKGEIPSKKVYEDKEIFAFEDINPKAPIHILIIPKRHIDKSLDVKEEDKELIGSIFMTANRLAKEKGIAESGFRLVVNCNRDSGQDVFHVHFHLLGGRRMKWPPG
jgi:histidine triad (HIT) family protein